MSPPSDSTLDHTQQEVQLREMLTLSDRLALEQHTAHERVLLEEAVAVSPLKALNGINLCHLRADAQLERARTILQGSGNEARTDSDYYYAVVPRSVLHERFGDAPLGWWQTIELEPTEHTRGVPPTNQVEIGEPMLARIDGRDTWGVYDGYDWQGTPFVRLPRRNHSVVRSSSWDQVFFLRPLEWRLRPFDDTMMRTQVVGLRSANSGPATPAQAQAFDGCIDRKALGPYSVRHFIDALEHAGYFVCMRGSAVRDAITGASVKDVDLVSNAPAAEVWRVLRQAAPEYDFGNPSLPSMRVGQVHIKPALLGIKEGEGFDITGMKRWETELTTVVHPETRGFYAPTRFGANLEEDAWAHDWYINTLYAYRNETGQWCLADPTNYAQRDIQNKWLREPRCWHNPRSARFWKFRLSGYDGDDTTRVRMRDHYLRVVSLLSVPHQAAIWHTVWVSFKRGRADKTLDMLMQEIGRVMREDGAGDCFERYVDTKTIRETLHAFDARAAGSAQRTPNRGE